MYFTTLTILSVLSSTALATPFLDAVLAGRQTNDEEAYLQEVCFPNATDPIPPCQEIINIQSECPTGNTTDTLGLEAHAQCICGGSFFSDWIGCLDCDYGTSPLPQPKIIANRHLVNSTRRALPTRSQRLQRDHNIRLEPPLHRHANRRLRSHLLQPERRHRFRIWRNCDERSVP